MYMTTFLFLNRWVGYAVGIAVASIVVVLYGDCAVGGFNFNFFMLDLFFGSILAYSVGLLIEAGSMLIYLKRLRSK